MLKNKIVVIIIFLMNFFNNLIDVNITNENSYLYIPKISLLEKLDYDKTLSTGSEIHKISYDKTKPLVIMGHSGIGDNAIFNDLEKLILNDIIIINQDLKKYYFEIDEIKDHNKGDKLKIINNSKYIYLVTCDKFDMQKQLIIRAKYTKNAKK